MQKKSVIFIADSLNNAHKFQQVLSSFDVEVVAGSSLQFKKLVSQHSDCDLVIYELRNDVPVDLSRIETTILGFATPALLVVVTAEQLESFRLPLQLKSDFVVYGATPEECTARIRQLLWPGNESSSTDVVLVDNMTVNLATYQVSIAGTPLDLTYLEYALLSFLVTHPGHTYSRDALLKRVWGFDYYGGSRTVDVHVRRVRAKLGPELAQHLETVRGVGYLWNV